ncbi:MAG: septum formation initiator family protein [Lachnospiraceae bacterium]|nr:septum formation initiator family protein [Lachnospiraceae bacterium]
MAGRTVSRNRANRRSILLVASVVAVLTVLAFWEGFRLQARNSEYEKTRQELELKIAEEEKRAAELEEYREYTKTTEFAEWYAKARLGLVQENEIIFKSE